MFILIFPTQTVEWKRERERI